MSFPAFAWAVGEESSDPVTLAAPGSASETVRVDQLAMSGHPERAEKDLADVAALGVKIVRYGIPWRVVEPEPGRYDWTQWDRTFAICDRAGLEPIVDLCHFGLPDHLGGFTGDKWVPSFVRYVEAFLARYESVRWFTPVNEPVMTSAMSARYGMWNDFKASDADFAVALSSCVLANLEAHARIVQDRSGWLIGAEAIGVPVGGVDDDEVALRLALERASWDLHFGFDLDPLAVPAFETVPDAVRSRIHELGRVDHVIAGHDFYPISVIDMPDDVEEILDAYEAWATRWFERYGVDFWVAETSNLGLDVSRQIEWIDALTRRLGAMRARGLGTRGLCWYSRGDQFDWQTALVAPTGAVTQVGLFTQAREARPVAGRMAELIVESA